MNELRISLVQSDIHWESIDANLAMYEEKMADLKGKTDLIVLPEMFSTGFSMQAEDLAEPQNSKTFRWMKMCAAQAEATLSGSYIVKENGNYYNRFYAINPDGSFTQYDKKHLFGLAGEDVPYTPGANRVTFEVKGWKIFPQICYDLRFPVWTRSKRTEQNLYEYDILLFVASWPAPRIHAWDTLLQARAIENIAYCIGVNRIGTDGVGATYIGHSAIYNYLGESVCQLGEKDQITTGIITKDNLEKFRNRFPFQEDADSFILG